MKKIYLSVLASLAFLLSVASPDIYTPELVLPSNNQTLTAPNVELDWNAVTGQLGLHYEAQLSTDDAFTNPAVFVTELTAYRMANLLFGTQYYWRVRAIDNMGTSEWSEVRTFTTIFRPVLRRPNDNATGAAPNVQIIWETVNGIANFDFQLDISPNFDSTESHITTVAGSLSQANAANLLFGTKYYLRLRMRTATDTSEWSVVRAFTTVAEFGLKKPDDGASAVIPDATFEWTKIDGLSNYDLYLSTEASFSGYTTYPILKNLVKASPDTLMFGTTYYWKMAAIHPHDTLISVSRSFTTVNNVTLTEPANNATNVELTPYLKWNKISSVLSYRLELSSNAAMTGATTYSIEATSGTGTEEFRVPNNVLDSANTYYWRVRAINSRDTSSWSNTWNFRCAALGVESPVFRNGLRIYPSPANDLVSIQLKSALNGTASVALYDLLGKQRLSREVAVNNGNIKDLQLGTLPDGVYMIRIESRDFSAVSKLIIKR